MFLHSFAKFSGIVLLFYASSAMAQWPCASYPADCPDTDGISDVVSQDVATSNYISPKEFAMQNSLRTTTKGMMQGIASHEGWRVEDFSEIAANGSQIPSGGALLADNLRPPHEYYIAYQFIVSNDSLQAWRTWQMAFFKRYTGSEADEKEKYRKAMLFRSACVVQVYFDFNGDVGLGQENNLVQGTPSTIPGASIVAWFHNPQPDLEGLDWHYEKSYDVAEILLGPWQPKRDSYNGYHSVFSANPKNMDEKSVKKIASDKVQTIAIHICGRKDNVKKFISQLDLTKLNALIEK